VLLSLKAEWADGTTHLLFEPIEFLGRARRGHPRSRFPTRQWLDPWGSSQGRPAARSREAARLGLGRPDEASLTISTCSSVPAVAAACPWSPQSRRERSCVRFSATSAFRPSRQIRCRLARLP